MVLVLSFKKQMKICTQDRRRKLVRLNGSGTEELYWLSQKFVQFFGNILWKNSNELLGQPNR